MIEFQRFERETITEEQPQPPSIYTAKGVAYVFFLVAHGAEFNVVHVAWDAVQGIARVRLDVDALPKHEMTAIAEAMAGMLPPEASLHIEMVTTRPS